MLFLTWVVAPLVLLALMTGVGLLVERASGRQLPGPLVIVVGFTGLVCATQVTTRTGATAPLTPYVAVALAVAGFAVGWRRRPDAWTVALGVGVFSLFGLPAFATGAPTVLGYTNMADAAGHFGIVDQIMTQGYSVADMGSSSLRDRVAELFATSYPTGAHTVLGTMRALVPVDVAWLLQPFLALLAALTALGLHAIVRPHVSSRFLAAGTAALGASPGLVYAAVVNQQAVKELGALVCVVALVGVTATLLSGRPTWRSSIPAAVAAAGGLGVINLAIGPWMAPLVVLAAGALLLRHRAQALGAFATFGLLGLALALPSLTRAQDFLTVNRATLTTSDGTEEIGNLYAPLPVEEALGVWPSGDFRSAIPAGRELAWLLVGAVAIGALFGLVAAVRRGAWPLLLFVAVSLIGFLAVAGRASPWAYAKALMLLSPVALLLAGFAVASWWQSRRRAEALILGGALALGVAWTTALAYHVVDPMPHPRFAELEKINERFAGRGPAYGTEPEEFAKHFLRDLDLVSSSEGIAQELVVPAVPVQFGYGVDTDAFRPEMLADQFKLLVTRRGPTTSRPPAGWEREWRGDFYDVWSRAEEAPRVLWHVSLGSRLDASGRTRCEDVRALAGLARVSGGELAYVPRSRVAAFVPREGAVSVPWRPEAVDAAALLIGGPGTAAGTIDVPEGGEHRLWLEASVTRELDVYIDGEPVAEMRKTLNPHSVATPLGEVTLSAGRHQIAVVHGGGGFEPGNGSVNRLLGPVYLTREEDPGGVAVRTVPASRWRSLCGEWADWVEVVA